MHELLDQIADLLAAGDRKAAQALVASSATAQPAGAELGLAAIALSGQDADTAREHAHRAIALGEPATGHIYVALAELVAGNAAAAEEHARRAVEIEPSHRARSTYANVLLLTGRAEEAAGFLRELLHESEATVDPESALAAARRLLDLGRHADARTLLTKVAAAQQGTHLPGDILSELRFLEGVVAEQEGDPVRALEAYGQALDVSPRRTEACTNALSVLLAAGALDEIPGWLERVPVASAKLDAELMFNESVYLARSGRGAEAIPRYERVLELTQGEGPLAQLATQHLALLRR